MATEKTNFNVGDTVTVHYQVIEGTKTRIQPYTGIVIGKKGMGINKTFTVRRIAVGQIGVERIFREFSPKITKLEVKSSAKVRRAKLNYIRGRVGKAASKL
ncbi:50S ribosomal protein L19 [candidate division WWE3 bacterium CG08_land_8_20_14_0_20_40_13]|uniref:50S ribosomal protein L19 n=1 Tax=candidate division WWE3 bacterium CG08_land_8_20_14_0_20_40_13 TaxID=1975084 RepID=A0A2H0XEE9_UNCKA|nr:MAG: 50S ribosomal protein L19 [candidate division WWE3 bacterium CG08_land_8_20_14_0_20_40_13]